MRSARCPDPRPAWPAVRTERRVRSRSQAPAECHAASRGVGHASPQRLSRWRSAPTDRSAPICYRIVNEQSPAALAAVRLPSCFHHSYSQSIHPPKPSGSRWTNTPDLNRLPHVELQVHLPSRAALCVVFSVGDFRCQEAAPHPQTRPEEGISDGGAPLSRQTTD